MTLGLYLLQTARFRLRRFFEDHRMQDWKARLRKKIPPGRRELCTIFRLSIMASFLGLQVPEQVKCRIDHYQTPTQVHVSVFAKKVVKDQSSVRFDTEQVSRIYPIQQCLQRILIVLFSPRFILTLFYRITNDLYDRWICLDPLTAQRPPARISAQR